MNESNSYMEVGKAMYARDKTSRAVPCWLIFDDRYRKRYAHQRSRPGRFPRKLLESGMLKQAWTLDDLARMCGIDPAGLTETVERFNENAEQGVDPDYGRGESAYNRALGDPNHKVHPCLGPIDEPPYYAVQVVPGDIGTCGGLAHRRARAGASTRTTGRSRACTPPATAPPPSWAATTSDPARASPTPWSSATWRPATPRVQHRTAS